MNFVKNSSITVITSTYNASNEFRMTANSLRRQSAAFQWIVIDGNSSDGTQQAIEENNDLVSYYLSEPDNGIYDAWNKALPKIEGEWVLFLGAGDTISDETLFEQIDLRLKEIDPEIDLVFGNVNLVNALGDVVDEVNRSWDDIRGKWVFFRPELPNHASIFHRSTFLKSYGLFHSKYKIAGDTHMLLSSLLHKVPLHLNITICNVLLAGVSNNVKNYWKMYKEVQDVNRCLGIHPPKVHFFINYVKLVIKVLLYKLFPQKAVFVVFDLFRRLQGLEPRWSR